MCGQTLKELGACPSFHVFIEDYGMLSIKLAIDDA